MHGKGIQNQDTEDQGSGQTKTDTTLATPRGDATNIEVPPLNQKHI